MKYFFGEVDGTGHSVRAGTMSTGLKVQAHSKQGTVVVQLGESNGVVNARVWLTANPKTGKGTERVLYDGPVHGTAEPDVVIKLPSRAVRQVTMPDPEILSAVFEEVARKAPAWVRRLPAPNLAPPTNETIDAEVTRYMGTLTPAGDESDQPYDNNEGYQPEPRRLSVGKLALAKDESD